MKKCLSNALDRTQLLESAIGPFALSFKICDFPFGADYCIISSMSSGAFFKKIPSPGIWVTLIVLSLAGCATSYLKGVSPEGKRTYLGPVPIENTEAFKNYVQSAHSDVDKQRYLFQRLKDSKDLSFYHDGSWYNAIEAYRGGMWLMRNRYQKGQDSREFIRKYVERSEDTGKFHLVKYPDGSVHIGSYILLNELDLLEGSASGKSSKS